MTAYFLYKNSPGLFFPYHFTRVKKLTQDPVPH